MKKLRALHVRMNDADVGRVERDRHGRMVLRYEDAWRTSGAAIPLSVALPLSARQHDSGVEPYLWGLLPDNEVILDRWATRFQTSASNALGLLGHVGADCPGAVELLTEEAASRASRDQVEWLDERAIAGRLRRLRADSSLWREEQDAGQFSVGGAQAKTALLERNGRWGIPSGRIPTTHIFKPGMRELRGHAENEHFCLSLLRELGLPSATSSVERFEDETAIIITRYDRANVGDRIVRVHQEDLCQATATMPSAKYQNEGGPGARTVVDLLRRHSSDANTDVATFIDAQIVSWAIVATDAHAKNYSFLHGPLRVRLAPLYDVASILPYAEPGLHKVKLAMSIGGKYRVNDIGPRQWMRFAEEVRIDEGIMRESLARVLGALPDAVLAVLKTMKRDGVTHDVVKKLADAITKRARALSKTL